MNKTPEITVLAKLTQEKIGAVSYGHLRKKLDKNGFSEIALYKAVTDHCIENDIDPKTMVIEMVSLLRGCAKDVFFPKTHNDYHYLRGCYYQLRHGNTDKGEVKSPEQLGKFLCNKCYLVKNSTERSGAKTTKHTCKFCRNDQTKSLIDLNKKRHQPAHPATQETPPAPKDEEAPMTTTVNPQEEKAGAAPEAFHPEAEFTISEVMADEKEATVTIKCPTKELAKVLANLSGML